MKLFVIDMLRITYHRYTFYSSENTKTMPPTVGSANGEFKFTPSFYGQSTTSRHPSTQKFLNELYQFNTW